MYPVHTLDEALEWIHTPRMTTEWTPEETALMKAARRCGEDTLPETRESLAHGLLTLTRTVFERAHHHARDGLRPSTELTRLIRLLGQPKLFPEGAALNDRLVLLLTMVEESAQRPVVSGAALVALGLELEYAWSTDTTLRTRVLTHCETAVSAVMPLIALEGKLLETSVATKRLEWQSFNDRRQRLLELIDVVDTYDDKTAIETLVMDTYEGVFDGLGKGEKSSLARRLLKELRSRRVLERHDKWNLLVDPLLLANPYDAQLQGGVLRWVSELELARFTPYMRFYLESIKPGRMAADVVTLAGRCGVAVLPLLTPVKAHRGFWGQSAVAKAGEAAYAQIVEREGLLGVSGGLALAADGAEGALSIADAQFGPLSINKQALKRPKERAFEWRGWYGILVLVVALVALNWML